MLGRYRDSHGRPQLVRTCAPDHTEKVVHLKNEKEKKVLKVTRRATFFFSCHLSLLSSQRFRLDERRENTIACDKFL